MASRYSRLTKSDADKLAKERKILNESMSKIDKSKPPPVDFFIFYFEMVNEFSFINTTIQQFLYQIFFFFHVRLFKIFNFQKEINMNNQIN